MCTLQLSYKPMFIHVTRGQVFIWLSIKGGCFLSRCQMQPYDWSVLGLLLSVLGTWLKKFQHYTESRIHLTTSTPTPPLPHSPTPPLPHSPTPTIHMVESCSSLSVCTCEYNGTRDSADSINNSSNTLLVNYTALVTLLD